jgi:predicted transcriptional regulator of viral defense system
VKTLKTGRTQEQALLALARKRGLLRTSDVASSGLPTVLLTRLARAGRLERAGRGVYAFPSHASSEYRSLAEVALRVPRGVVCLLSALRVHQIGTQAPFEVWLALPAGTATPRIESVQLRVIRLSRDAFNEGVEIIRADGAEIRVYNAAKTVADCFKFRNKIGLDVALEALREGWRERRFTMADLSRYARTDRVANVMRPYMESLT